MPRTTDVEVNYDDSVGQEKGGKINYSSRRQGTVKKVGSGPVPFQPNPPGPGPGIESKLISINQSITCLSSRIDELYGMLEPFRKDSSVPTDFDEPLMPESVDNTHSLLYMRLDEIEMRILDLSRIVGRFTALIDY